MKRRMIFCIVFVLISVIFCSRSMPITDLANTVPVGRAPVILIDAGHGGMDGGAVAADGTVEKEINLQIAQKLKSYLCAFGFTVRMTRQTDRFVCDDTSKSIHEQKVEDIHNRLNMLEETDAQMLISIHQNKFGSSSVCGTQVFYSGGSPQSEVLAEAIQAAVRNYIQPENTRLIKESTKSIYLLYHATKPAVMVECGFISNGAELQLLLDDEYQNKMCLCILRGILEYQENRKGSIA